MERGKSLLRILEENSDDLRRKFFQIRAEFLLRLYKSTSSFQDTSKVEYLVLSMSRLVESCIVKSSSFLDLFKLMALDHVMETSDLKQLAYVGAQKSVAESLLKLCQKHNLEFHWEKIPHRNDHSTLRKIWIKLPNPIRSQIWLLKYLWQHWTLRRLKKPKWFKGSKAVFIFSYFAHLDKDSCELGKYSSRQWEALPDLLRSMGNMVNWAHIFLISKIVPDIQTGIKWLNSFNRNSADQGAHIFLNTYLDISIIIKVLLDWLRVQILYIKIGQKVESSLENHQYNWLWPTLKKDWCDSMTGITAMNNILFIHLFEKLLGALPYQNQGFYLSENQSWERAFLHAWRKHGHGRIVGVAHSTIRYWDLRYYDTSMTSIILKFPRPDVMAINGSAALLNLQKAGYHIEHCVQVEALRYLYLNKIRLRNSKKVSQRKETSTLLVLGDIKKGTTHRMMKTLEEVFFKKKLPYEVWIKPHPHNYIELGKYPKLKSRYMDLPLLELLPMTKLAFSSVFTSAALDIFCAGVPVINYLDCYNLNFSSMRGIDGTKYISTSDQLLQAMEEINSNGFKTVNPKKFFLLDEKLPKWKALIEGKIIKNQNLV